MSQAGLSFTLAAHGRQENAIKHFEDDSIWLISSSLSFDLVESLLRLQCTVVFFGKCITITFTAL